MVFLELAIYGIRNFTQLTRFAFKPGLNLIQGGNGSGKSTICNVILAALSPISDRTIESLKSQTSPNICQAALIYKTNGRVGRIVRDFISRKSSLAELDASNKFHVTMQEEESIAKSLMNETGGLPPAALEGLFTMKASWLPSACAVVTSGPKPDPSLTLPVSAPASLTETKTVPQDRSQKQKRLGELKALLAKGDQLAAMEDQLSDLQARSAEAKRRLRFATEKTNELARLMQQSASFESMRDLPEDYPLILETSAQQEQLKNEQLTARAEEEEFIKQDLAAIPKQPFFLTKFFITGGVLVLAALIVLIDLDLAGLFQHLVMLILLAGAGLMGYAGYLDFGKLNKRKGLEQKLRDADRQRARIEAAFKKENAPFIELLKKAGCADVATLKEKTRAYEQFIRARHELESERDQFLGKKTIEEMQKDADTLAHQITEIESKLKASSTLPSDLYLIQEEVRALERELASSPAADSLSNLHSLPKIPATDEPILSVAAGRIPDFLSPPFWAGLQTVSVRSVLRERLSELNRQVGRLIAKMADPPEGEIALNEELTPVLTSRAKAPIPWGVLSSGRQDLYHLICQLAVIQILSPSHPFPIILDNPLSVLDPAHQQRVVDILREIAQNRQVLLFSSASHARREGDHLITLK